MCVGGIRQLPCSLNSAEKVLVQDDPHTGQPAVAGTDGAAPPNQLLPITGPLGLGSVNQGTPRLPPSWEQVYTRTAERQALEKLGDSKFLYF